MKDIHSGNVPLYSEGTWHRAGHGSSFSFFLLDEELIDIMRVVASELIQGESFVCAERQARIKGRWRVLADIVEFDDLLKYWRKNDSISCFLYNDRKIAEKFHCDEGFVESLAISGFVLVQRGIVLKSRLSDASEYLDWSRVAIANKVMNADTGELLALTHARKVFSRLKSRIKKQLVVAAEPWHGHHAYLNASTPVMSLRFANECLAGKLAAACRPVGLNSSR